MVVKRRDTPKFGSIGDGLLFFFRERGIEQFRSPQKILCGKKCWKHIQQWEEWKKVHKRFGNSAKKVACRTGGIFAYFRRIEAKARRAWGEREARVAFEERSAKNTAPLALRARLFFASISLKYAKNFACSAGYEKSSSSMDTDWKFGFEILWHQESLALLLIQAQTI